MTATVTGPLLSVGLSPTGMAAILAAPDPHERISRMGLLSWMTGGEGLLGIGGQHTRVRHQAFSQAVQTGPIGPTLLAATAQGPPPQPRHPVPESPQAVEIP